MKGLHFKNYIKNHFILECDNHPDHPDGDYPDYLDQSSIPDAAYIDWGHHH